MKKTNLLINMIDSYHRWLGDNEVIREVVRLQGKGKFSPTRAEIGHYLWFLEMVTNPSVLKTLPNVIHVLDVGAYLNLFSNFLKNIEVGSGRRFDCAGIELRPEYCELSNHIFHGNRLVCGDAVEMDLLFDEMFDIIIFCGFFHWDEPLAEETIKRIMSAADNILARGNGIIAIRSPDEKKIHSRNFFLPSSDAGLLSPNRFMPDGYSYSERTNAECWFIARKRR